MIGRVRINSITHVMENSDLQVRCNLSVHYVGDQVIQTDIIIPDPHRNIKHLEILEAARKYFKGDLQV